MRVVLGHFVFVYIHPYMDGNGRMGRFLMNAMLATPGRSSRWSAATTTWRPSKPPASGRDIGPFAALVSALVQDALAGKPTAPIPTTAQR